MKKILAFATILTALIYVSLRLQSHYELFRTMTDDHGYEC